jgi:hypothetical protein
MKTKVRNDENVYNDAAVAVLMPVFGQVKEATYLVYRFVSIICGHFLFKLLNNDLFKRRKYRLNTSSSLPLNKDMAYVYAQEVAQVPQGAPPPICNPNSPTLQSGSTGPKVMELQRFLTQLGYGSLLGQVGIDGKFRT